MPVLLRLFPPTILIALTAALAGLMAPTFPSSFAAETGQVQPARLPSGDDFATQALANPWDMRDPLDIDREKTRVAGNVAGLTINNAGNGLLEATATNNDPRIWIRVPANPLVNVVPQEGSFAPINAGVYRYVTARVWVERTEPTTGLGNAVVVWQQVMGGDFGTSSFARLVPGWNIVTIDLQDRGFGATGVGWSGNVEGFYFDPVDLQIPFKIDFIRLSTRLSSVNIPLPVENQSSDVWVGRAADASDASLVVQRQVGPGATWNTSLAAGLYYIWTVPTGSRPSGAPNYQLPVNTVPLVKINAPGYVSGPDYATSVLGNPWDMADSADVAKFENVINQGFQDGLVTGTNDLTNPDVSRRGDPGLRLNVGTPIDTGTFKYLTVRMFIEGERDETNGSVARVLWWSTRPEENTTSRAWVVYEGWQTKSFDLSRPDFKLEPNPLGSRIWTNSRPIAFRFDPHEFGDENAVNRNIQRRFYVDYIALTGDDTARGSYTLRYSPLDADGTTPQLSFFYDTDAQGFDGQPITCAAPAQNIAATAAAAPVQRLNQVYLPLVVMPAKPPEQPDNFIELTGESCRWDLSGIPAGRYWVYIVSTDGVDSYRTYSETPLIVQ